MYQSIDGTALGAAESDLLVSLTDEYPHASTSDRETLATKPASAVISWLGRKMDVNPSRLPGPRETTM
jgi:hypothetical protein